ncbi:MAG: hypothetical protein LQ340_007730, partial [Diploschistes diacapsis]
MARIAQPLSPQHTGGSMPLTISHPMNTTPVSSMASFAPSAVLDEKRGRTGRRSGKDRYSPRESRADRPPMSNKSSSGNGLRLSELSKKPSDSSLASPPLSAYSNFDITSPPTPVPKDPKPSFSQTKVKIRPLLRKMSSQEQNTVDLSRSVAENEGLGIFTNSSNTNANTTGRRGYHARTSSGVSQVSSTTTSSTHPSGGAQYVHPMRQTPQSYVPTLAHSRSRTGSTDTPDRISHSNSNSQQNPTAQSYAPLPSTARRTPPPPLQLRTYSSNSRGNSTSQLNLNTQNIPGTPSSLRQQTQSAGASQHPTEPFSPDTMPLTARSSLESAFSRKRSRTNTTATMPDNPVAHVQALRQEFYAREAAKDAKYAEREARKQERREASQRRREEHAERRRARSSHSHSRHTAGSEMGSVEALRGVGYESTVPAGLPVDEELEWIRRGKRPEKERERIRRARGGGGGGGGNKDEKGGKGRVVGEKAEAVKNG